MPMKKITTSIILVLMLFIINVNKTNAEEYVCDQDEYNAYKLLADQIKLTYEHVENMTDSNGNKINDIFNIVVNGLHQRLSLYNVENQTGISGLWGKDGKMTSYNYAPGTYTFQVRAFSAYCGNEIFRIITITIPKYNEYSEKEECKDVDPSKFALCDPYYQNAITDETFQTRIEQYKKSKKEELVKKDDEGNIIEKKNKNTIEKIKDFVIDYYIYFIIGLSLLIILVVVLIILIKKGVFKRMKENNRKFKK